MIEEKHLDPDAADRIGNFVRMSGGIELIDTLMATDLVSRKTIGPLYHVTLSANGSFCTDVLVLLYGCSSSDLYKNVFISFRRDKFGPGVLYFTGDNLKAVWA
jgi:hypothetical protein